MTASLVAPSYPVLWFVWILAGLSLPSLGGLLATPTPAPTPAAVPTVQKTIACVQNSVIPCVHTGGVGATLESCMALAAVSCAAVN